jgi:hypothetical protein
MPHSAARPGREGGLQTSEPDESMTVQAVLLPIFVQVGLTFILMLWMGRVRLAAIRAGEVKINDIALRQPVWPQRATQVANTFHNQLELPILFYALVALALITRKADLLFVVLSWMFVATRIVHAFVYTTSNDIRRRFAIFLVGALVLLLMWAIFAIDILFAPVAA